MNIYIFHNDLRLCDNTALLSCLKSQTGLTLPIFIFTPDQISSKNKYRSEASINFMCNSLSELNSELKKYNSKLHTYYGSSHHVIKYLIQNHANINAVYSNMNYTPFSIKRDKKISDVCRKNNVEFVECEDFGLLKIGQITTNGESVYKKFTPYYRIAKKEKVKKVAKCSNTLLNNFVKIPNNKFSVKINDYYTQTKCYDPLINGGRIEGMSILKKIAKFKKYDDERNTLSINTTQLSAYIKFGCVSIREVYWSIVNRIGKNSDLIKQLFWREFYMNILWQHPHIISDHTNRNFKEKYANVKWKRLDGAPKYKPEFKKWCNGNTGYPIVDACMRQLNNTGYMHNRGRLIVAGFLVKILGWHWELGEKYFATKLRDYDPAQNNGGWQFVSGSGVDSQPYFRIFNPWLQSLHHDTDCIYIKKWVPELSDVPPNHIHNWFKYYDLYDGVNYPKPMVNYEDCRDTTKKIYLDAFK
jgi:deoxyribodipyrimidine photo-lyase